MNKKDYQELFKNKKMSINSAEDIKNNVLNKNTRKKIKPIYACIFVICFIATIVTPVTANIIGNSLIEVDKDTDPYNKPVKWKKAVYYEKKLNKDYSPDFLKENEVYTIEELENKLGIEIPKNNRIIMNNLRVNTIESVDNKVSKININNEDKKGIYIINTQKSVYGEVRFGFTIYTKYSTEDAMLISGMTSDKTQTKRYYIKNLDTEAIIIYDDGEEEKLPDGRVLFPSTFLISFEYKGIVYGVTIDGYEFHTLNDVYKTLDSFYI